MLHRTVWNEIIFNLILSKIKTQKSQVYKKKVYLFLAIEFFRVKQEFIPILSQML